MESDIDAAARFEVNQFMFECARSIIGLSLTDHQKHTLFHRFKKVLEDAEYKIKQARESAIDTHANAAVLRMCHEARMMNGIVDYSDPKAVGMVRKVLGTLPVTADGCVAGQSAHLYQIDDRAPGRWFDYYTGTLNADGWYSTREAAEAAKVGKA